MRKFLMLVPLNAALAGCAGPTALPREFSAVARTVATSLTDQAVWKKLVADIGAEAIEPGLEVSAGVKYFAAVRITGVAGRVGISGTGGGSGELSSEARRSIVELLGDDEMLADRILGIVTEARRQPPPAPQPVTP